MSGDTGDGFLSRWSRRKRGAGVPVTVPEIAVREVVEPEVAGPDAVVRSLVAPEAAPLEVAPLEVATLGPGPGGSAPAFDPASLPAPETLTAASDITGFLRAEVPAALRRAALRRIWTLDPGIRDFIGPADYAWDYNAPDGVPGFALSLGGDVQKLLAQAMGWQPATEETAPEAPAEIAPEAPAEASPEAAAEVAPVDDGAVALPAPRPDEPPGCVVDAGSASGQPPAGPALAADVAEPVAQRRHGGAMPS